MLHSMTAFARRQETLAGFELAWEMRSLNQRFLEVQFRLPEELRTLEHPLREKMAQQVKRGKLMCVLSVDLVGAHALELNRPLLLQLLAALEQVRRDAPEAHAANPIDLLRWPGMLKNVAASEPLVAAATELFENTLGAMLEARADEGEKLKAGILQRLAEIERIVSETKELAGSHAAEMRARLRKRLAELEVDVNPYRLEQEVALLAQKADVAEELDRLAVHLQDARSHLDRPGPHGRRLDFISQEMMREANTLAAKSVLPRTSRSAVDLKVAVEQVREQAQNIE